MDRIEAERDGPKADAAEHAFEALCAEVAALRQGIELVYRQGEDAKRSVEAPDYSPTLGTMAKELQGISARLKAIEGKPGLALSQTALDIPIREASAEARRTLSQCQEQLSAAVREVQALAGQVRARQTQRSWLLVTGLLGVLGGACLWFMLVGLLPGRAGAWLGALPIGDGPWQAGQVLMREGAPVSWERMVRLYNACPVDTATEQCEATMTVQAPQPGGGQGTATRNSERKSDNGQETGLTDRRPRR